MTNGDFINGIISDKKFKNNIRKNCFIQKLRTKIYSSLSKCGIRYLLKFPIPKCHRQFFGILSQNPEYVQTHCNAKNNPSYFAIRKWMINQI